MIDLFNYEDMTPHKILLEKWGPSYWKEFKEMQANYAFAGWTLDLMAYILYREINNLFVSCADEKTTEKYEKLFGITPVPGQDLENRRAINLIRFIGKEKISFSTIKDYVRDATGCECELFWDEDEEYALCVRVSMADGASYSYTPIHTVLASKLPAHIRVILSDLIEFLICDQEKAEFHITIREPLPWWYDHMLDGTYTMNGEIYLDEERGPYFNHSTVRTPIQEAAPSETVYARSEPYAVLDGTYDLDGTVEKLNSYRVELGA